MESRARSYYGMGGSICMFFLYYSELRMEGYGLIWIGGWRNNRMGFYLRDRRDGGMVEEVI